MSVQYRDACYPDGLTANGIAATYQTGHVDGYVVSVEHVYEDHIRFRYQDVDGMNYILRDVSAVNPPCQLLGASDAFSIGWQMVAVWVAVYGVRMLTRVIDRHFNGSEVTQ